MALVAAALVVGACGTGLGGSGLGAGDSAAGLTPSFDDTNIEATDEPDTGAATPGTGSEAPGEPSTPAIPGFDGWRQIDGRDVDLGATQAGLAMTLLKRALWSGSSQGVLFYTLIDGDFRVSATVSTSKTSDSSQDPGGDGSTQLAGLMARLGSSSKASFVSITVGADAGGLAVETSSTTDGQATIEAPAWPTGDAELKLCRIGTTFSLWKRTIDSGDDWTLARTVKRPDLGGTLQVGSSIGSDRTPDITAQFGDLEIDPLDPGEAC